MDRQAQLRLALSHLPGADSLQYRSADNVQFITINGITVETPLDATDEQIAVAFNVKKINALVETPKMGITGNFAADFRSELERAKADIEASRSAVKTSLGNVKGAVANAKQVASSLQAEADELNAAMGQVSNGG